MFVPSPKSLPFPTPLSALPVIHHQNVLAVGFALWMLGLIGAAAAIFGNGRRLGGAAFALGAWALAAGLHHNPRSAMIMGIWAIVAGAANLDSQAFIFLWRAFGEKARFVVGGFAGVISLALTKLVAPSMIPPLAFAVCSVPAIAFLLVDTGGTQTQSDQHLLWRKAVVLIGTAAAFFVVGGVDLFFLWVMLFANLAFSAFVPTQRHDFVPADLPVGQGDSGEFSSLHPDVELSGRGAASWTATQWHPGRK